MSVDEAMAGFDFTHLENAAQILNHVLVKGIAHDQGQHIIFLESRNNFIAQQEFLADPF